MSSPRRHSGSRAFLTDELRKLKERNPQLSLRGIARLLGLSPSHLSQTLSGKKNLSPEVAEKIAKKLKLYPLYEKYFLTLVEMETASASAKPLLKRRADTLLAKIRAKKLAPEGARARLRWEHLLLVVCLELRGRTDETALQGFAQFAGIKPVELRRLLTDLKRAELVRKVGSRYERTDRQVLLESGKDNRHLKAIHSRYLDRAKSLIASRSPERRFSATDFYSIPADKLDFVRERTEEYLDEIAALASEHDETNAVIEIALHWNLFEESEIFSREG